MNKTSCVFKSCLVILTVMLVGFVTTAQAENRALIIGIGAYENSAINLQGPRTDVLLMEDVAKRLGFRSEQVLTLLDEGARRNAILEALEGWLVDGVTAEDKVLLFFSGHGHQLVDENGDEADGCDEAWLTHDMQAVSDDVLADVLGRSLAANILVIIDSCFSGTMTRAYQTQRPLTKLWRATEPLNCIPLAVESLAAETGQLELAATNIIELSASAASELAYDAVRVNQGSVFTQALYERVVRHAEGGVPLSLASLQQLVETDIARTLNTFGITPHIPQLSGPSAWLTADLFSFGAFERASVAEVVSHEAITLPLETAHELNRHLDNLLQERKFVIDIEMSTPRYNLDEAVVIQVTSPQSGYLYLFGQTPDDSIYLIFPNQLAADNIVQADTTINIPGPRAPEFRLYATEPLGQSHLLAVVTTAPLQTLAQVETATEILARYKEAELARVVTELDTLTGINAAQDVPRQGETYGAGITSFEVVR
ncbi:MAG: caspase family protein [Deinococcota bacterium]